MSISNLVARAATTVSCLSLDSVSLSPSSFASIANEGWTPAQSETRSVVSDADAGVGIYSKPCGVTED
jgi:hypothetical protein